LLTTLVIGSSLLSLVGDDVVAKCISN